MVHRDEPGPCAGIRKNWPGKCGARERKVPPPPKPVEINRGEKSREARQTMRPLGRRGRTALPMRLRPRPASGDAEGARKGGRRLRDNVAHKNIQKRKKEWTSVGKPKNGERTSVQEIQLDGPFPEVMTTMTPTGPTVPAASSPRPLALCLCQFRARQRDPGSGHHRDRWTVRRPGAKSTSLPGGPPAVSRGKRGGP